MFKYLVLIMTLVLGGIIISIPLLLLEKIVLGSFCTCFLCSIIVFMMIENLSIMEDFNIQKVRYDQRDEESKEKIRQLKELNSDLVAANLSVHKMRSANISHRSALQIQKLSEENSKLHAQLRFEIDQNSCDLLGLAT